METFVVAMLRRSTASGFAISRTQQVVLPDRYTRTASRATGGGPEGEVRRLVSPSARWGFDRAR